LIINNKRKLNLFSNIKTLSDMLRRQDFALNISNFSCGVKKLLSLPNFYFPIDALESDQIKLGGFGDIPHMKNLKYLMQNPAF
jgi:hypothetical protein